MDTRLLVVKVDNSVGPWRWVSEWNLSSSLCAKILELFISLE